MNLIWNFTGFVTTYFDPYVFWAMGGFLFVLGLIGLSPFALSPELGSHQVIQVHLRQYLLCLVAGSFFAAVALVISLQYELGDVTVGAIAGELALEWVPFVICCLFLGLLGRFATHRYIAPKLSLMTRSLRIEQETEELSDIVEEIDRYQPKTFKPSKYYIPDWVFTGLTMDDEPVYIAIKDWYETHKAVIGATRFGKGVTMQSWLEQAIMRGDTVFVIDPKKDKFMPHVLRQACEATIDPATGRGRRFISLDLVDADAPGRYSPFDGGSPSDRRSRFFNIMEIEDRGTDADHYKALSREQAMDFFVDGQTTTVAELYNKIRTLSADEDDPSSKALSTVRARLKEWGGYDKLQPKSGKGFSVERSLLENAVVYIRGSLDDGVVLSTTRAIIMEICQEARRLSNRRTSHLTLVTDELKFLNSREVQNALATISGFDADIITAFQNFGDLTSPADTRLDGESVKHTVLTNSQVKVFFGGTDPDTAEYVEAASGQTQKKVVMMERTEVNRAGGEVWAGQRTIKTEAEGVITMNEVLSLPPGVAAILRPNSLAKVIAVSPVKLDPPPTTAQAAPPAVPAHAPTAATSPVAPKAKGKKPVQGTLPV
ncbi:MAG TPA: type IV secretion system DNA-binding domain-containing protein [Rhizomicrobium sp.]|nr:type IV secretion system DNA-binding domain-containing protein [Rhizomicrobium sp.]